MIIDPSNLLNTLPHPLCAAAPLPKRRVSVSTRFLSSEEKPGRTKLLVTQEVAKRLPSTGSLITAARKQFDFFPFDKNTQTRSSIPNARTTRISNGRVSFLLLDNRPARPSKRSGRSRTHNIVREPENAGLTNQGNARKSLRTCRLEFGTWGYSLPMVFVRRSRIQRSSVLCERAVARARVYPFCPCVRAPQMPLSVIFAVHVLHLSEPLSRPEKKAPTSAKPSRPLRFRPYVGGLFRLQARVRHSWFACTDPKYKGGCAIPF